MDLVKLADEMKGVARLNPHDQSKQFIMPEVCYRVVTYESVPVNVAFTYNIWPDMTAWQLSLSRDGKGALAEKMVQDFVKAFLGTQDILEFTNDMHPEMRFIRQFVKRIT